MTGAIWDSFQGRAPGASKHFPQVDVASLCLWAKPSWDEGYAQRWVRPAFESGEMLVGSKRPIEERDGRGITRQSPQDRRSYPYQSPIRLSAWITSAESPRMSCYAPSRGPRTRPHLALQWRR